MFWGLSLPLEASSLFNSTESSELNAFRPSGLGLLTSNPFLEKPDLGVSDLAVTTDFYQPAAADRQMEMYNSTRTVGAKSGSFSGTPEYVTNMSSHRLGNRDASLSFKWFSSVGSTEISRSLMVEGGVAAELFQSFEQKLIEGKVSTSYNTFGTPVMKDDKGDIKVNVGLFGNTMEVYSESFSGLNGRKDLPPKTFFNSEFYKKSTTIFIGYVPITVTGRLSGSLGYENAYMEATLPNFNQGLGLYAQIVPVASLDVRGEGEPGIPELNRFLREYGAVFATLKAKVDLNLMKGGVKFSARADKSEACLQADTNPINSLSGKMGVVMEFRIPIIKTVVEVIDYLCQYDIFGICNSSAVVRFKNVAVAYATNKKEKSIFSWSGTNLNSGTSWGKYCKSIRYSPALASADSSGTSGSGGSSGSGSTGSVVTGYEWRYSGAEESGSCYSKQNSQRTDNVYCGKAYELAEVTSSYCFIYKNGLYDRLVDRGVGICPAAGASSNSGSGYRWDVRSGEDDATGRCINTQTSAAADNHNCGKASTLYEVKDAFCFVYKNGYYDRLVDRGVDGCPSAQTSLPVVVDGGIAPPPPTIPNCLNPASDPDGDGWGWENGGSCIVQVVAPVEPIAPPPPYTCSSSASDPDGDGWGWENGQSCVAVGQTNVPYVVQAPKTIASSGSFVVEVRSNLSREIRAEIYLKEVGGNWTSHAEQQFILRPGLNRVNVNIHTYPQPANYRVELRTIENNSSTEVFAQPVTIQY
jgi:hypothetical protein